ncbi:hypothetical protein BUALT_BualtUnG0015100 [Buddleja alternifolia]|uniref:AN1-type domain-containing protein n=1 Tax=Buddleja alternifolia TaxID=168488 RepID=A0AAV6W146_9LAMI|nr:hypothetical protein BUALT_BualtUnG0015100 [Buddleja alternifolia]
MTLKRPREVNRCSGSCCRKQINLTIFGCRCGDMFCSEHIYSDRHDCSYDYKAAGREAIAKENQRVNNTPPALPTQNIFRVSGQERTTLRIMTQGSKQVFEPRLAPLVAIDLDESLDEGRLGEAADLIAMTSTQRPPLAKRHRETTSSEDKCVLPSTHPTSVSPCRSLRIST